MPSTAPLPPCPSCHCVYTYENGALLVCPECAYEWTLRLAIPCPDRAKLKEDPFDAILDHWSSPCRVP